MTAALASLGGILTLVGASVLLLARELRIRALNARVERAVTGVPGQSAPFRDIAEWLFALGTRYRRFYSPENLEQLRTVAQASGLNPHRIMPIIIGGKTLSMLFFPTVAAVGSAFMGVSLNDRLIPIGLAVVFGIMGPRLVLRLIGRRFNAAV